MYFLIYAKSNTEKSKSENIKFHYLLEVVVEKDWKESRRLVGWNQGGERDTHPRTCFCRVVTFGSMLMFHIKKINKDEGKIPFVTQTVTNELTLFQMNNMTIPKGEWRMSPNHLNTLFRWYPSDLKQK